MPRWLFPSLGLDPARDELTLDRIFWVHGWPVWAALLALALAAAWVCWCYYRDGTRPSWWWKGPLATLRIVAMLLLLLLIWQPMLRSERTESTSSIVALVIDESQSMAVRDRWQNAGRRQDLVRALADPNAPRLSRAEALSKLTMRDDSAALRALLKTHEVRVYRFGAAVQGAELAPRSQSAPEGAERETLPLRPARATSEQTRIGSAIDHVLQDTAGQPLAGIVLLSDGGQNVGEDPGLAARRAAEAKVPIFTVGFGDPTPPRDLAVTSVLSDEVVRKGDEVVVTASLRHRGFDGQTVSLTLSLDGQVLQRTRVRLGTPGKRQDINLSFTPAVVGAKTLTVSVPGQQGEITLSNNQKAWPLRIVDKKLKILYVEGYPRWEYRYLKNAILRDPTTLFSCILVEADPSLGGEGNVPIYRFPSEKKQLFEYDILILGDVPRDFFTGVDLKNIRAFVGERGGSLVTMAGENFLPWQYRGTELEAVLPIVIPAVRREQIFREPFQLRLTDAGARHPMCFLVPVTGDEDAERNRMVWHSLPGLYWCGIADRAKPGATVLAEHPSLSGSEGPIPLMAVQQVGEGTSFQTMVDSTWQWRYRVGDKFFYRFWGQVVRSLTPHELPGANRFVRLTADRATYSMGERVVLRARLLTPNYHPVRAPQVTAEMVREDGQRFPVRLEPVPGAPGSYSGEWLPSRSGAYRALLTSPGGQRSESVTNVVVEASSLELEQPEQNEPLLRRLAQATGGRYLLASEFAGLPSQIPDRHAEVVSRIEHELWDAPLPLALFVLLLTAEWILRKRKGLL